MTEKERENLLIELETRLKAVEVKIDKTETKLECLQRSISEGNLAILSKLSEMSGCSKDTNHQLDTELKMLGKDVDKAKADLDHVGAKARDALTRIEKLEGMSLSLKATRYIFFYAIPAVFVILGVVFAALQFFRS